MKKLFVLGMSSLMALGANAQTLEERVEALEFSNYERFFNWSGQLEMRWDAANRDNKSKYETLTDPTAYLTDYQTALTADGGTAGATVLAWSNANCGDTYTGANTKDGCSTVGADQKDAATLGKLTARLNFDSKPSDKLTVYGRLSMSKYMSVLSKTGTVPSESGFNDLYNGAGYEDKASIWVERIFANYKVNNSGTFTFGRMPTIYGGPKHLQTNEPMSGNYPIVAFAGIFDGMAYTHNLGSGHTLRAVYAPFQLINFSDTIGAQYSGSDKLESKIDTYTVMYEFEKSVSFARKLHIIAQYFQFDDMPFAGTNMKLGLSRSSLYSEMLGLAGSKFDLALAYMSSETRSEGGITGIGGWMTESTDKDTVTGGSVTALIRYSMSDRTKFGVLYTQNDKETFAYDSASQDPTSPFSNYGTSYRGFMSHDFEGGLKLALAYTSVQTDYLYQYVNKIGKRTEVDRKMDTFTMKLMANF